MKAAFRRTLLRRILLAVVWENDARIPDWLA